MSQVRPFRLECDRRAWRVLARSSPEIRSKSVNMNTKFKAKPVPKNLFSTEIYDRMLEDEYYRSIQYIQFSSYIRLTKKQHNFQAVTKTVKSSTINEVIVFTAVNG